MYVINIYVLDILEACIYLFQSIIQLHCAEEFFGGFMTFPAFP